MYLFSETLNKAKFLNFLATDIQTLGNETFLSGRNFCKSREEWREGEVNTFIPLINRKS